MYNTVDLSKNSNFLKKLKERAEGKYFVFDNFHYLHPSVQQEFCTLLKEFNYQEIKVKAFLQRYCQAFSVDQTLPHLKLLADSKITEKVTEDIISEMYIPLHDRIVNLSMPQRERKDSKKMRLKIVIAVLKYIIDDADANTQTGIPFNAIKNGIDSICNDLGDDLIGVGNLTQELGLLHTREENRQTKSNVADGLFCREIDGLFCRSSPDIIVRRRCVLSHKRRGWLQPSPSFRYSRNLALQDELYHPVINNGPAVLVCVDKRLGTGPVNQSRDAG